MDEDDPARKHLMDQQERFAVGMIGFSVEHDAQFRARFLERVCGLKDLSRSDGWEVLVEPENWGDLVLKHPASSSLLVAEFKIGAKLEEHQNPSMPRFSTRAKNGECAGYGWEIAQVEKREKWKHLRYVTIENNASWNKAGKATPKLVCVPSEWRHFLRGDVSKTESKIEAEVYDSLANFGIQTFIVRRMKHMKHKLAEDAPKPLAILFGVLEHFNVEFRPRLFEVNPEWVGAFVTKKNFPAIAKIVDQPGKRTAWFGYHSGKPEGPRLSVELYYHSSKRRKASALKRLKRKLTEAGIRKIRDQDWFLEVFCKAEDSPGDLDWFIKVLTVLNK